MKLGETGPDRTEGPQPSSRGRQRAEDGFVQSLWLSIKAARSRNMAWAGRGDNTDSRSGSRTAGRTADCQLQTRCAGTAANVYFRLLASSSVRIATSGDDGAVGYQALGGMRHSATSSFRARATIARFLRLLSFFSVSATCRWNHRERSLPGCNRSQRQAIWIRCERQQWTPNRCPLPKHSARPNNPILGRRPRRIVTLLLRFASKQCGRPIEEPNGEGCDASFLFDAHIVECLIII